MSITNVEVSIRQLLALPVEKRIEIMDALWESVESELGPMPIPEEILDEADQEFEAHLADPSSSTPWEEVRAKLRKRFVDPLAEEPPQEVRISEHDQAEMDRRLAEHRRNPDAAAPVDTFLDELDRRYA